MSIVSNVATGSDNKKRVQIITEDNTSPTFVLETPNPKLLFATPSLSDLPTTAELMQRCLAVNPFEAKFREANQRINNGGTIDTSVEQMELNGLVPFGSSCIPTSANMTDFLLKLPSSTLQQSPGIFSNISFLAAANDNDAPTHENLKTADISKLLSAVSAAGDSAGQAPRTADVLNAVLDMHSDRLHTINYINKPDFSALLRSPSSSAPNSAGILNAAICAPSTSGGLLGIPPIAVSKTSPSHSPRGISDASRALAAASQQRSPTGSDVSTASSVKILGHGSILGGIQQGIPTSNSQVNNDASWDPRDVKPSKNDMGYFGDESASLIQLDDKHSMHRQGGSEREMTPSSSGPPSGPGRGRGRGRSTTADMQPDERRMTILERNKAAAVRYRKRKKEEHDDMIGRVHGLEQEKATLATQNQVLRRELERVTALLHDREARCVCLKGMPLSSDLRLTF